MQVAVEIGMVATGEHLEVMDGIPLLPLKLRSREVWQVARRTMQQPPHRVLNLTGVGIRYEVPHLSPIEFE